MQPSPKSAVVIVAGATVASNATASGSLDCLGYNYAVIDVMVSTSATASHTLSALVLAQNSSAATGGTAVSTGGTDFTIPTSNVTTPLVQMRVDLRGKRRYLTLQATPNTSAYISAIAHLFKGDFVPVDSTAAGVGVLVNVDA